VLGDAEALASLYRAVRSGSAHPSWAMGRGAASRATIHHMGERLPPRRGRLRTLVRQG
jgi:hypothetical protein